MNMVQKFRIIIVALCIAAIYFISSFLISKGSNSVTDHLLLDNFASTSTGDESDYSAYLQKWKEQIDQSEKNGNMKVITLSGADFSDYDMDGLRVDGERVITEENGTITYKFNVPVSGAYNIEIKYLPITGKGAPIVRSLFINGVQPFDEAANLIFERIWVDENKAFLMKTDSNQAFPAQVEAPEWVTKKLESSNGYYNEPFIFSFSEGENELSLQSLQEPMEIEYIKLTPVKKLKSYEDYKSDCISEGINIISKDDMENGCVSVQAEDAYQKTTSSLIPVNDRTSVKTIPYHASNIVLNTIGGDNWSTPGEGIAWKIDVPKAGLYKIAVRFKQVSNRDFYSIRKLTVNGEVPFKEASEIKFNYKSKFQLSYLGDGSQDYYFYFKKGINTISLAVTLGSLGPVISEVNKSINNFNELYREIIQITGTDPDQYRDYKLTTLLPDLKASLETEYNRLTAVVNAFGNNNQKTSEISSMLVQLKRLLQKPDNISKELKSFNDNISALSNWTMTLGVQPLLLDYISVCGDGYQLGKPEGNLFQNMKHNVLAFVASFTNDYTVSNSKDNESKKNIEVWISTSRDQYNIVQRMVNKEFTDRNFTVTIKMVGADTIMPSTISGNGPDVAIQINGIMPSNFAFRNAAYDLTKFKDFEEVSSSFPSGAMEYFEYQGSYYALPDQMSFPVMFYRKDIIEELGLEIPNTWDDLLELMPYLQARNMDMCLETYSGASLGAATSMSSTKAINSILLSMLYQNGEELYKDGGSVSNLDSDTSLQIFKKWTEFYTKNNMSVSMDFVTRFRKGSVPIGIVDFTYYNTLKATAPEIDGLWGIAPIPGTVSEDGAINRSTASIVGASMILKNTVDKKGTAMEAWEFLKWWTGSEAQVTYSNELEAVLGAAARYPVANLDALEALPWTKEDLTVLEESISNLRGIPQVPGGYITGRYIENAFLRVVDENIDPVDTLYSMVEYINQELKYKQEEFKVLNRQ
ncbi:MAG TPA: extracellular solute-binding protein [Mobilitalea sp.]|nr:extracellular solute-binding protein [Mobilitalea sp.]